MHPRWERKNAAISVINDGKRLDRADVDRVLGGFAELLGRVRGEDDERAVGGELEELGRHTHALPVTCAAIFVVNDSHRSGE